MTTPLKFDDYGLLPSLHFDKNGTFLSGSPYPINGEQFNALFVFNALRKKMVQNFISWNNYLIQNDIRSIVHWISGSFIEKKDKPNDIDVLTFYIPSFPLENKRAYEHFKKTKKSFLNRENTVKKFNVEPQFICLLDDPLEQNHISSGWSNLYSLSNKKSLGRRRGFVSINANFINKSLLYKSNSTSTNI